MFKKATVIIPARFSAGFIRECLDSIESQTGAFHPNSIDILLGIDNCHDTLEAAQLLQTRYKRLEVYFFKTHVGPYVVRNTLAGMTNADFLIFFDSDDIMLPGFINAIYEDSSSRRLLMFVYRDFSDRRNVGDQEERIYSSLPSPIRDRPALDLKGSSPVLFSKFTRIFRETLSRKVFRQENLVKLLLKLNPVFQFNQLRISGLFAISAVNFSSLKGFKPWPVAADSEFEARAKMHGIKPRIICRFPMFLRRIHAQNLTLSAEAGHGSSLRQQYNESIGSAKLLHEEFHVCRDFEPVV